MIIQEPIKATILFALNNFAYSDAIFLSERLYSEVQSDESLSLLATAFFRSGKANIAYSLLANKHKERCNSPECRFLMAKCCFQLQKYSEALDSLIWNDSTVENCCKLFNKQEFIQQYGEISSFVAQLLGSIYKKLDQMKNAIHYYTVSLEINPFLWSSFEYLVQLDPSVEVGKLINMDNCDFTYTCGTNKLVNFFTNTTTTTTTNSTAKSPSRFEVITPEVDNTWQSVTCLAPSKNTPHKANRKAPCVALKLLNTDVNSGPKHNVADTTVNRNLLAYMESFDTDTSRHAFGVLQLDKQYLFDEITANDNKDNSGTNRNNSQRITTNTILENATPAPVKKPHTRRNTQQEMQEPKMQIMETISTTTTLPRRSSRLYSGSRSVKENASSPKTTKGQRTPALKRTRRTISFEKSSEQKEIDSINQNLINESFIDNLNKVCLKSQRSSAHGLLELMGKFATAYKLLAEFRCKEAIDEFTKLPFRHYETGLVLSSIGRAYFEMSKYEDSVNFYEKSHRLEPYRVQGMEYYSTALWHLQKEVHLSCLSQKLIEFDKNAPETWCVAGNCFSLQKEHEVAIKFLNRAIQVDPEFSYAYTLLGHEFVSADDYDNALSCFRNATRIDKRHYNGWYGIGMINYKQEKYNYAYQHYKRALKISPLNPVLMCHLGITYHHIKQTEKALKLLDQAAKLDPTNALIRFHRSSIYFSIEKYPKALEELEQLKKIVPKEAMVYFLIGKIHKLCGDTHLALMNFSWAMDLDPKGASNRIKELIDRQYGVEDDVVIHSTSATINQLDGSGLPSQPSTPNTTPFQQRRNTADEEVATPSAAPSNASNDDDDELNINQEFFESIEESQEMLPDSGELSSDNGGGGGGGGNILEEDSISLHTPNQLNVSNNELANFDEDSFMQF